MDDHVGKPIDRDERSATLARWLAPADALAAPCFDRPAFDRMCAVLGPDRMRDALAMFGRDLGSRLCAGLAEDAEALRSDAPVVTSMAGILGFTDLSRRCAALAAEGDGVAAVLRAKRQALARLAELLDAQPLDCAA